MTNFDRFAPTSPRNAEHAELMLTELERVECQVAELLRFARREEIRLAKVDLGQLVRKTIEELRPSLEEARVEVTLEVADGLVGRADRERLCQVLINLIDNARQALCEANGARRLGRGLG